MRFARKRLTYANVMSSIAVFLVLGGGAAFAATQLPKNSVGSPQIKKNAVNTGDIAPNAVRVGKLAPEAVKAGKIAKNAIVTNRLRDGAVSTGKIQDGAITTGKIQDGAVTTGKIQDGAVTTGKIADNAVTGAKVDESTLSTVPDSAALGGKAASEYTVRYFARVDGTPTVPLLEAGSPGVSVNASRPFTGAATVVFPLDVSKCAIEATVVSGGGSVLVPRQSSISSGANVVIVVENTSGTGVNSDFNVVAVC